MWHCIMWANGNHMAVFELSSQIRDTQNPFAKSEVFQVALLNPSRPSRVWDSLDS